MKQTLLFLAAMLILGGMARAAGITGHIGCAGWGFADITGPLLCSAAPPPASCSGSLDLSSGCPQPMLGVM